MTALGIDIGGSSVKTALLQDGRTLATGRSGVYDKPDAAAVAAAIREALFQAGGDSATVDPSKIEHVGLCAPGLFDTASRAIALAVNMPGLVGVNVDQLVAEALWQRHAQPAAGAPQPPVTVVTDAHAAAVDCWSRDRMSGRLLALSLGTGVGASILDDGEALTVTGRSCGHLGQIDVSLDQHAPVGPDGGGGSLEAYLGLPALRAWRPNTGVPELLASLTASDPPIRALVRALRIAHAIYRPDRIVLLGGVGVRLAHLIPAIKEQVSKDLTRLARPGWQLCSGDHDWHAAAGAARLAASAQAREGASAAS